MRENIYLNQNCASIRPDPLVLALKNTHNVFMYLFIYSLYLSLSNTRTIVRVYILFNYKLQISIGLIQIHQINIQTLPESKKKNSCLVYIKFVLMRNAFLALCNVGNEVFINLTHLDRNIEVVLRIYFHVFVMKKKKTKNTQIFINNL